MKNPFVLVCYPTTMPVRLLSKQDVCYKCGRAVWRAISSPPHLPAICLPCAVEAVNSGEEIEIEPPTAEQLKDMFNYGSNN